MEFRFGSKIPTRDTACGQNDGPQHAWRKKRGHVDIIRVDSIVCEEPRMVDRVGEEVDGVGECGVGINVMSLFDMFDEVRLDGGFGGTVNEKRVSISVNISQYEVKGYVKEAYFVRCSAMKRLTR